uniref:Prolyl 4-hydroxylase alpha subunit Fe(2+) 2OG dioxygenase domain-containing protein n=2 Tax=Moniliophthora roreri TaxID=221103 RepID=A0A0W0GF99_MONRR
MKRDRAVSESSEVNVAEGWKKQKVAQDLDEDASFGQTIRSAYDLTLAIRMAIGDYYLSRKLNYDPHVESLGNLVADFEVQPESDPQKAQALSQLTVIHEKVTKILHSYHTGFYDSNFNLKVTQPGCECEAYISRYHDVEDELPKWLANAPVSGYGDNRTLETKVDSTVRNAREIPSSGFEVSDKLLTDIASLWSKNFLPSKVRVQPYKIHLYGEGGHFQSHKDTPETDLVGTFLLGIGDSAADSPMTGNLCIGDVRVSAHPGQWVAFHPDVPHSVSPLTKGCRAVIAFKIFSVDSDSTWGSQAKEEHLPKLAEEVTSVLEEIPRPFGMILEHQYPMGTREASLAGIDAIMLAAGKKLPDSAIEIIPVVIKLIEEDIYEDAEDEYDDEHVDSRVMPFTRHHVDLFLGRNIQAAKEAVSWLDGVESVPFYALNLKQNGMQMSSDSEQLNWRGNESDGTRESSVYLTYAMLVLPRKE